MRIYENMDGVLCKNASYEKTYSVVFPNLWFDGVFLAVVVEPGDVNFNIKMSDVTDNCIFSHRHEMFLSDDVTTAGSRNKNMSSGSRIFHGCYFVTCMSRNVNSLVFSQR